MTPEQAPSWWNDLTLSPKKLARKRLEYALASDDPLLQSEARIAAKGGEYPRARTASDPFSEEGITEARRLDAETQERHDALARQEAVARGNIQEIAQAPDETIIRTPERTIARVTRKLPETPETAQVPVVRRGRRNNGAIRRTIPDVEVGVPPELVQVAERRQEVIPLSPYTGKQLPARPGAAIPRHIPQAPVTAAPPMPSGLPEVPDVPMQGPLHMIPGVIPSQASGQARRGIRSAHNQAAAMQALGPMPTLPPFGPGATAKRVKLPALPGSSKRQMAVASLRAQQVPMLPGASKRMQAVNALHNSKTIAIKQQARPPAVQQPAQNTQPTEPIPVINQQAAQQAQPQIPQPARVQHTPIYGVNPGILLLAGMSLVAVNFMGQILGSANSVNSLADLLLQAPTGKTQGIISKLPANTLGTLLAESALVVFLALVMGNINNFTNFLAAGIIGLFWLIWLIENGDKLANIWKSVTGAIAGITKGGSSKGWTLPSGGF